MRETCDISRTETTRGAKIIVDEWDHHQYSWKDLKVIGFVRCLEKTRITKLKKNRFLASEKNMSFIERLYY